MLKQCLSEVDFGRSMPRFKIEFYIGKTHTSALQLNAAEPYLYSYHNFVVDLYKEQHSDIAASLNQLGIYFMKATEYPLSLKNFG